MLDLQRALDSQGNLGTNSKFAHRCPRLEQACKGLDLKLPSNPPLHGVNIIFINLGDWEPPKIILPNCRPKMSRINEYTFS